MLRSVVLGLSAASFLAVPAVANGKGEANFKVPAGAQVLVCDLPKREDGSWVSPVVALIIEKNGKVQVYDAVIDKYIGAPIDARVATDNAVRTTYRWTVKNIKDNSNRLAAKLDYALTVKKATLVARVSMNIPGYDNQYRSDGRCKFE